MKEDLQHHSNIMRAQKDNDRQQGRHWGGQGRGGGLYQATLKLHDVPHSAVTLLTTRAL